MDFDTLLAILNSRLMNWIFKKTSTNNHVNIYELETLPIKSFSKPDIKTIAEVVKRISEIRAKSQQGTSLFEEAMNLQLDLDGIIYKNYGIDLPAQAVIDADMN